MRCYYCDGEANNTEYLDGRQIYVCNNTTCQQEFWEAERNQKQRDRDYDNWRLRSE